MNTLGKTTPPRSTSEPPRHGCCRCYTADTPGAAVRAGGAHPPHTRPLRAAHPVVWKETIMCPFLPHPGKDRAGPAPLREASEPLPAPSVSRRAERPLPVTAGAVGGWHRSDWQAESQARPVCRAPVGPAGRWLRPSSPFPLVCWEQRAPPPPPPLRGHLSLRRK